MRQRFPRAAFALALCSSLALFGCTGRIVRQTAAAPAVPEPATVKVSGQVTAPDGLFTPQQQQPVQQVGLFDRLLISPAYGFSAVVSLSDVSVGVWTSDAYGGAIGSPICVAQTNGRGHYELPLPVGYAASPSLVIRAGDPDVHLRRMVTGVVSQDLSLATEIGLQVVLSQTNTYPVDLRVIPATQYETVYTAVGNTFQDYDLRPIMLQANGSRKAVFEHTCLHVVHQIQAQPAAFTIVSETVHGSYEAARKQGHGVLLVGSDGRSYARDEPNRSGPDFGPKSYPLEASAVRAPRGPSSRTVERSPGSAEQPSHGRPSGGAERPSPGRASGGAESSRKPPAKRPSGENQPGAKPGVGR